MDADERQRRRLVELAALAPIAPEEYARRRLGSLIDDPWLREQLDRRLAEGWEPFAAVEDVAHRAPKRMLDLVLEAAGPRGAILDFGCGYGSFRNFGMTYGDVPNPIVAVDRGDPPPELSPNARYVRSDLSAFAWDGPPFDVVMSLHVIEQLRDAPAVARRLRSLVREGGLAFLAIPDTRSLHSAVKHVWKERDYDERQLFTFEGFDALIQAAGFRRECWSTWPSYFSIHYGHVALPGGRNLGDLLDRVAAQLDRACGTVVNGAYGFAFVYRAE